jgi:hypothetical protein
VLRCRLLSVLGTGAVMKMRKLVYRIIRFNIQVRCSVRKFLVRDRQQRVARSLPYWAIHSGPIFSLSFTNGYFRLQTYEYGGCNVVHPVLKEEPLWAYIIRPRVKLPIGATQKKKKKRKKKVAYMWNYYLAPGLVYTTMSPFTD